MNTIRAKTRLDMQFVMLLMMMHCNNLRHLKLRQYVSLGLKTFHILAFIYISFFTLIFYFFIMPYTTQ